MAYNAKRPFSATLTDVIGTVTFTNATYRNAPFEGTYDLVKDYQEGGNGVGFVTIRETTGKKTRITVPGRDSGYTVTLNDGTAPVEAPATEASTVVETEAPVETETVTRMLTYAEASAELGISVDAVRKRVIRGTLNGEVVDGTKYVVL